MSNKYCQALVELRNKPAHELKEVGDQWRTPDNQHAKQQIALESQRTQEDIKVAVADDDCASRHVPAAAADRLRKYANSLRTDSGGTHLIRRWIRLSQTTPPVPQARIPS